MQVNGMHLAFLDIPKELTEEYNRWYDLDHMPEHVAKDDVLMGRRYVAPKYLVGHELNQESPFAGGHGPYLTIYSFGGPLDMESEEARAGWRTLDNGIVRAGRYWQAGRGVGGGRFRLEKAVARPDCLVQARAIPYLHHKGVIVALGKAPTPEGRAGAVAWWDDVHLPDLFAVPGVLAAIRGNPVEEDDDQILHVILCDRSPLEVLDGISAALKYAKAVGRYPAHRGAYESLCFVPFDTIVPLQYDFDLPDPD
jgi:hypothetical protein